MPETFIHRIDQIILSNIENEGFGVSELASQMGLSRSQVLRKIRTSTGKSANHYIREVRLNEAAKLILQTDYTASEIAYRVGFSSPSYFNKCFLDHFGITPGDFKKQHEEGETPSIISDRYLEPKKSKTNRIWILSVFLTVVIAGYYFLSKNFTGAKNSPIQLASIAVLPLDDYSENKDKEYLADGLTEAITLELSKIESLRVIARGSTMRYKGEKKAYSDIANELGVDLLLEGSVLPDDDTLRVVVQLINPFPKERHVWANSYHQTTSSTLQLVQNISTEIAREIGSAVSVSSETNKTYRINPKAYDLYLKGKHIWNNQKTRYKSLITALDYLNESIKTDPDFAPAYVTLAETYMSINFLILDNEEKFKNRDNARRAIEKAMDLDKNLAEAYTTKGNLVGKFDWDWVKMKEMAEKGLELEPNNANAHVTLSNYYVVKGDYQRAIHEALKAEELDPINPNINCLVAERYYIAEEFDKSIDKYNEVIELNPNYGLAYNGIGYVYMKAGDQGKAVESWQKLQLIMGNNALYQCYNDSSYEDCLHFFLLNAKKGIQPYCSNPVIISSIFMMVDDEKGALEYLENALQNKNEDLPIMIAYPDFYALYNNPEFKDLTKKVGVVIPN